MLFVQSKFNWAFADYYVSANEPFKYQYEHLPIPPRFVWFVFLDVESLAWVAV